MNKQEVYCRDICKTLIVLLQELNQVSARVNSLLKEDLAQTRHIVNDVINNMINSFDSINGDLDSLTDLDATDTDYKINNEAIIASIKSSINIIHRCLQFEDIVQQLIVHSSHLIEQKEKLLIKISSELQDIDSSQEFTLQNELLIKAIHAVKKSAELIEKESPVKQNSLKRGDIELF